ncbi:sugar ABC transporter permease [Candidatus Aerophobetes bacterium]|nr:sugar ABC transporter permease [Candidatus Aerophobetes bacterium]
MSKNRRVIKYVLILPAIVYLILLTVYPFIYSIKISLTTLNIARPYPPRYIGLGNYAKLLSDSIFLIAMRNTFFLTAISICAEFVLGFIIARIFFIAASFKLKGIGFLRTIYMLPMMITPIIFGLIWLYIFNPTLGVANYFLSLLGLPPVSWLGKSNIALYSIILVNVWEWAPFMMLLCLAGLSAIPPELFEVARIDGASWHQSVAFIELPLIKRVIVIGLLIRIMDNFRLFDLVYVTTGGGPGSSTETLSMFAYRQSFMFFNVGYGAAASIIILILGIILAQVLIKYTWGKEEYA